VKLAAALWVTVIDAGCVVMDGAVDDEVEVELVVVLSELELSLSLPPQPLNKAAAISVIAARERDIKIKPPMMLSSHRDFTYLCLQ
jgi:hypothetical protein